MARKKKAEDDIVIPSQLEIRPETIIRYYEDNGTLPDDFCPYEKGYVINPSNDLLFIGEKEPQSVDESYKGADSFFGINDKDPDRKSIYITLPRPPQLDLIDGYGLPQDDQYWRRKPTPEKLRRLEKETLDELQSVKKTNRQEAITGYKLLDLFWDKFEENYKSYKDEVKWIKNMWWWRIFGFWFYNDGKPTYITGRHFSFLTFFYMADLKESQGYPEYRDRHRREFLYREHLRYAHHTFAKRDERGWAVPEDDGHYEMVDMRKPIFLGDIHPKSRRNGSTMMGLHEMIEGAELGIKKYSTLISKDGDSTIKHYKDSLIPAWGAKPMCFKPMWKGGISPEQIRYYPPNNSFGVETIMSVIEPTTSAGMFKSDGNKFSGFILFDEEGKSQTGIDVAQRWNVYRQAMTLGDSSKIIGYCSHISTVEEIGASGIAFLEILENSDYYLRGANGRTLSGLGAMFFPAYDGLEGFIDRFGLSVIGQPTDRQIELRPDSEFAILGKGAYQYQEENRADYIAKGTPSAMRDYRAYVKKFPHRSTELTIGTSGDCGFSYEIIDARIAELRKLKSIGKLPVKIGNFYRDGNNNPEGKVYWRTQDDGKFELSLELPPEQTNLKKRSMGWNVENNRYEPCFEPVYKSRFTMGLDPFEYSNSKADSGVSKQSDGGIAVLWEHDPSLDRAEDQSVWESRRFVLSYRYRPASLQEFNEDCLMAAEYFGAMVFMERNKTSTWEYFIKRGRGNFLKYEQNLTSGKLADKPGFYSQGASKDELFAEIKDYIEFRGHKEVHLPFLEECRAIRAKDDMTKYDRFTAHGAALLGSRSPHGKSHDLKNNQKIDLGKCRWLSQ